MSSKLPFFPTKIIPYMQVIDNEIRKAMVAAKPDGFNNIGIIVRPAKTAVLT